MSFATGCASVEENDGDDANVEVVERGASPTGIVVDLAGACATKGMVYSPETNTCVPPLPLPGQPGVAPTVCKVGEVLVGIYCYPKGVYPRPVGHEADCRLGTVKYGSLCVSNVQASCDPQYTVSTLGPLGYYCGPNAELSGAIGDGIFGAFTSIFK